MISCIIPCYRSAETIAAVVDELKRTLEERSETDYEIILVNDASPDNLFDVIRNICNQNPRVKAIDLAKNFGQHAALMAGIKHARGDILICLDDDGQTPASEVGKLISALDGDCDVVYAKYDNKRHSAWRNIGSRINDYMAETLIGKPKELSITSYFACKSFIADEIRAYNGAYPYLAGLLLRSTKRIKNVPVTHRERASGRSGYTMGKLISLWLNGFTAFSVKPLRIATLIGFFIAVIGFIYGAYVVIRRFINPDIPMGYSSTMAVLLFIGGMIMVMLGLIGEYIGRIYININNAPQYVVRERIGFSEDK